MAGTYLCVLSFLRALRTPRSQFESAQLEAALSDVIAIGETPPTEFRLFPKGKHTSTNRDEPYLFDAESARAVMAAYKKHGVKDVPLDYGHAMLNDDEYKDPAEAGKAAGWFNIELRDGELWAVNVRYTPKASEMLANKEYRFISPAFLHKDGHILDFVNCALTNTPATDFAIPLVQASRHAPHQETQDMKLALVLQALNLPATTTEEVAFETLKQKLAGDDKTLLELTGAKSRDEAVGVVTAWKSSHGKVDQLSKDVEAIKTEAANSEVFRLVRKGISQGKIPPAQKKVFRTMSIEQLKAFLKTAVPIVGATGRVPKEKRPTNQSTELTAEELEVARVSGIDVEKLKAVKAKGIAFSDLKVPKDEEDSDEDDDAGEDEKTAAKKTAA